MFHFPHSGTSVQAAQARLDRFAVSDHVGHARGDPQIVFQYVEAVVGPHQVSPANGDPRAMGSGETPHLNTVLGTSADQVDRNHSVFDNTGFVVDVLQKQVQGFQTLGQTAFQEPPIFAGEDPGKAVDGNDSFFAFRIAVDREGDSFVGKRARHPFLNTADLFARQAAQGLAERPPMFPCCSVGQEHLVIDGRVKIVGVEFHSGNSPTSDRYYHGGPSPSGCRVQLSMTTLP